MPRIRFGDFQFDEHSGELWRGSDGGAGGVGGGGDGDGVVIRLPPQSARLLSHLIERRPHIIARDEIRQVLWPDVAVDFEQSLHTCIRKIRAALDDSASDPRYIETIPRRGYRFIGTVEPDDAVPRAGMAPRSLGVSLAAVVGLATVVGLVALLIVASSRFGAEPPITPARIAVMPFEPTSEVSVLSPGNGIAESIVNLLANEYTPSAEIIGPTTTQPYGGGLRGVRDLVEELDVDYVVNARDSTEDSGRRRLLIELIRGRDGAHIWVSYLDELPAGEGVAETIADAVAEAIK